MKKYGRRRQHPRNLPDNHPPKGWVNWWEDSREEGNKGRERQQAKKVVNTEIVEYSFNRNRNVKEEICRNCDGLLCRQGLCRLYL